MKHYAKKRAPIVAVQWTGSMTPEMTELLGEHKVHVDDDRQLIFSNAKGPGRFAREGDWIYSASGEDLAVMGAESFLSAYEEVDAAGRTIVTSEEHEADCEEFAGKLDALLVDALRLSPDAHHGIWRDRHKLVTTVWRLLDDRSYTARQAELKRVREKIVKELWP